MRMLKDQRGVALVVELLLVAIVTSLITIVGYRYYLAHHNKPAAVNQTANRPSSALKTLKVSELGVEFVLDSTLPDLVYHYAKDANGITLGFSTQSLASRDAMCDASQGAQTLGLLNVLTHQSSNEGAADNEDGTFVGRAGGYFFYYHSPQSPCSDKTQVEAESVKDIHDVLNVLKTVRTY